MVIDCLYYARKGFYIPFRCGKQSLIIHVGRILQLYSYKESVTSLWQVEGVYIQEQKPIIAIVYIFDVSYDILQYTYYLCQLRHLSLD